MLDKLLQLSEEIRHPKIQFIELVDGKVLFDSIVTVSEKLGIDDTVDAETRTRLVHEYVCKHPHERHWEIARIYNYGISKRKKPVVNHEVFCNCKVSTKGEVVVINDNDIIDFYYNKPNKTYPRIYKSIQGKVIHRIVASTFIPKPYHLKDITYKYLMVNHIDYSKNNSDITNLEWVPAKLNSRHAVGMSQYSKEKYFLFEVVADNGFKGRQFVLHEDDLHLIGANFSDIRGKTITGSNKTYRGFFVTQIEHKEIGNINVGFPEDIAELYNKDTRYFDIKITPIIATALEGRYKGFRCSFFGTKDILQFFDSKAPYNVINGECDYHRGFSFYYGTYKEAIPLHNKLTQEIFDDAEAAFKHIATKVYIATALAGKYKGQEFSFFGLKDAQSFFSYPSIHRVINSYGSHHKGFSFRLGTHEEAMALKNVLTQEIVDDAAKAYRRSDVKSYIATALAGKYKGQEFSFIGRKELKKFFNGGGISSVLTGKYNQHKGFALRWSTHEEAMALKNVLTQEIVDETQAAYQQTLFKPIIATALEGEHKGQEFPLIGDKEPSNFFYNNRVNAVIKGKYTHSKGFTFRYATYEEAMALKNKLTKEIVDKTEIAYKHAAGTVIIATALEGNYKGQEFSFIGRKAIEQFFTVPSVYQVLNNIREHHKGFTFRYATYEEAMLLKNVLTQEIVDDTQAAYKNRKRD